MDKEFFFVDGIQPDRASKRLMRRHVMKGKNAGKTINRPSRLQLAKQRPGTLSHLTCPHTSHRPNASQCLSKGWIKTSPYAIHGNLGGGLFTFMLPVKVTPDALRIIHEFYTFTTDRIYPARLGISLDNAKGLWLRVLFSDEASYYCNIGLMQACNEIFLGNTTGSPKALHHLSQTLAQVKRRLESDDALSDSTIGIVLSLVAQEQIRQDHRGAKTHFDGLEKIVELRGGLDQLEGNLPLLLKVCKTDIIFSLQNGGPTKFFRDRMAKVRDVLMSKGILFDHGVAASFLQHHDLDPCLHEALLDIISACLVFNNTSCARDVDLITFQEMLMSICFRLLRFRSLDDPNQTSDVQSAYHVGLTIFMVTIFLQYDRRRIMNHGLISKSLSNVIHSGPFEHDQELLLWLMIVGGIWISGDLNGDWLLPGIRNVSRQLNIETWADCLIVITKFPWIKILHDEPGRALWDHAMENE
ncbi:hypothetical protein BGZ63DRAFT_424645 [Mariannaea sp. PMI_226]|nr:hypothetical protein BGZ63DRAFT_424645 [Mariannaea sp. PMI_226]